MSKVLLINVDSTMPNLALMKISAYHKALGDDVSFTNTHDPDYVYASIIFKKNKHCADGLKFFYPNAIIDVGGSGYDLNKTLPDHIEYLKPDYSLYPEMDYSLGFTTRGCNRKCHFCIVNEKEGNFHTKQHPARWYNPEFKTIMFFDNNILFDKEWFMEVTTWCIEKGLKIEFNQGLDIRLMDHDVATRLNEIKISRCLKFAWDNIEDEPIIRKKIQLLKDAGFTENKLRNYVELYVYTHNDKEYDSAVYRCRELKKLSCAPFVMFNMDETPTPRINKLKRWSNRKQVLWSIDIKDYDRTNC